jgi:outer membrane murein-binding lipoprotein Lpp
MDISQETDVNVLKALAYDELQKLNIAQSNVQMLQQRISQLQETMPATNETKQPTKP